MKKVYLLRETHKVHRASNALFVKLENLARAANPAIQELAEDKKLSDWVGCLLPFELGLMRVRRAEDENGPFLIYEICD